MTRARALITAQPLPVLCVLGFDSASSSSEGPGHVCISWLGTSLRQYDSPSQETQAAVYSLGVIKSRGPVGNRQWKASPASRSTVASALPTATAIHCCPK